MMKQAYIIIHHALHSDQSVVSVDGIDYPVMTAPNNCRYVIYHKVRVIQQDPRKSSTYAERARTGEQISWVMEHPAWICIDAEAVNSFLQKQGDSPKTTEDESKQHIQPGITTSTITGDVKTSSHRDTGNLGRPQES